ncbi:MAG: SLC13/DASS family transporter, partial [Spirochaetales bacterium]|nr:SLC13/DASS family transporter [Spirochaetales bacterium]
MDFAFFFTAFVLFFMTFALLKEWFSADVVVFCALLLLILGGVIDVQEAFAGFSNTGMLTVGFLFVVAFALQKTGALNRVGDLLFGKIGGMPQKLLRLMLPVSFVSAFFNNTPIVAMFIPVIKKWTKNTDYTASKFLIPLSYATILGGTCTLIGTSTTLVVHGLMLENGMKGIGFFEMAKIGIPVALAGLLFIAFIGHYLLPERKQTMMEF